MCVCVCVYLAFFYSFLPLGPFNSFSSWILVDLFVTFSSVFVVVFVFFFIKKELILNVFTRIWALGIWSSLSLTNLLCFKQSVMRRRSRRKRIYLYNSPLFGAVTLNLSQSAFLCPPSFLLLLYSTRLGSAIEDRPNNTKERKERKEKKKSSNRDVIGIVTGSFAQHSVRGTHAGCASFLFSSFAFSILLLCHLEFGPPSFPPSPSLLFFLSSSSLEKQVPRIRTAIPFGCYVTSTAQKQTLNWLTFPWLSSLFFCSASPNQRTGVSSHQPTHLLCLDL